MKNLITKAFGIAGLTALSFLPIKDVQGQDTIYLKENQAELINISSNYNKEIKRADDSVIKFNEKNLYVYKDFVNFIKEKSNPNTGEYLALLNTFDLIKAHLGPFNSSHIYLDITSGILEDYTLRIRDINADGLSDENDAIGEKRVVTVPEFVTKYDSKEQIAFAILYTNLLKKLMHIEGYRSY